MEFFIMPSSISGRYGLSRTEQLCGRQMPKPDSLACLEYRFSPSFDGCPKVAQMVIGLGYFASVLKQAKEEAWSHKPLLSTPRQTTGKQGPGDEEPIQGVISPSTLLMREKPISPSNSFLVPS